MPELKDIATQIRRDIVRMVHGANSGHPGGSLGCADFFTALYFKIMKHDPAFQYGCDRMKMYFFYRTVIFHPSFILHWHVQDILI